MPSAVDSKKFSGTVGHSICFRKRLITSQLFSSTNDFYNSKFLEMSSVYGLKLHLSCNILQMFYWNIFPMNPPVYKYHNW